MNLKVLPDGVWAVMITPFNSDKTIDFDAYEDIIEFYISKGISGLFACCGSSELEELDKQEMLEIISAVVERVSNRVPVVGGAILFSGIDEQVDFIKGVYNSGVDAVVIATNQLISENEDQKNWQQRLSEILNDTGDIPLGTYELPVPWHRIITNHEFEWMKSTGRFVFHKDTSCDLAKIKQKTSIAENTSLKVFTAYSPGILASLRSGINGYCGTGANFVPELYNWLCNNYKYMPELADKLQSFLTSFEHRADECENYPANAKAFMRLRKVKISHICRYVQSEVTPEHIKKLKSMLDDSKKIMSVLQN